uniref:MBL fold metallo-hydrolase n=1 Tax=Thermorudis peleae TaxID=1382356 RepID=A0A831X1G0_9BACT
MTVSLRLLLLGTGSPRPTLERANTGQVVFAGERTILVDCGAGVMRRLLESGLDPARVTRLFLTHLHSDHTLDYAEFILGSWAMGREELAVYGPPGTARLHRLLLLEPYADDIAYRVSLGRSPAGVLDIAVHECPLEPGVIYDDGGLRVSAVPVIHSAPTLALRFDYAGRSLVISGDTAYCPELVELARGAAVLVHDACLAPALALQPNPLWGNLAERLRHHHATPAEAARVAREAGVRTLVLTHFLRGVYEGPALEGARREFDGEVILGRDLMEIAC